MHLHRDYVRALDEQRGREFSRIRRFLNSAYRKSVEENRATREIGTLENLRSVKENHASVVPYEAQHEIRIRRGISDGKVAAEISGYVFVVGVRSEAHNGGLISISITELGDAVRPSSIRVAGSAPGGAQIGAFIVIIPKAPERNERVCCRWLGSRDFSCDEGNETQNGQGTKGTHCNHFTING